MRKVGRKKENGKKQEKTDIREEMGRYGKKQEESGRNRKTHEIC